MKKVLITITILVIIGLIGYFSYTIYKRATSTPESTNPEPPATNEPTPEPVVEEPKTVIYDEKPVEENGTYFEKFPIIKGQQAYVAFPIEIDPENPPRLIIYSHGSNTNITTNMKEQQMKDMRGYGKFFTGENFAFAASNMRGANWGSDAAVMDMKYLIDWVKANYKVQGKINLLAHSMGGLPSFNFAFKYAKTTNCIALLAPTSYTYSKAQLELIKDIPIYIWHGNSDVNVPLSLSTSFKSRYESFGYDNLTLEILKGKTHWDVDTELKDEILEFYTENE